VGETFRRAYLKQKPRNRRKPVQLSQQIQNALPAIGSTNDIPAHDVPIACRILNQSTQVAWYLFESDGNDVFRAVYICEGGPYVGTFKLSDIDPDHSMHCDEMNANLFQILGEDLR